jgi:hypothetical protein
MARKLVAFALALAVTGCAHRKPLENVALRWKPTDSIAATTNTVPRALSNHRVQVMQFEDGRESKELIGRNVENARTPLDVTSDGDVGGFCAERMRYVLTQAGVDVAKDHGTLVITGQVTKFFVREENVYEGSVALRVVLKNRSGGTLWKGTVAGAAKRWGKSYSEDNYFEVLSDAYLRALQELFQDEEFRAAVRAHA